MLRKNFLSGEKKKFSPLTGQNKKNTTLRNFICLHKGPLLEQVFYRT